MKKNKKGKGSEYIGLKECFGTTTLSFTHALTGVLGILRRSNYWNCGYGPFYSV